MAVVFWPLVCLIRKLKFRASECSIIPRKGGGEPSGILGETLVIIGNDASSKAPSPFQRKTHLVNNIVFFKKEITSFVILKFLFWRLLITG